MTEGDDVLVGLRFEVSGGLGRMSGRIMGKAGGLYLVQKDGATHLELLELDDLRSAKFYRDLPAVEEPATMADPATDAATDDPQAATEPPRKRLADQIRKRLSGA